MSPTRAMRGMFWRVVTSLRVRTAEIFATALTQFRDRLGVLQIYIEALLGDSIDRRKGQSLRELDCPPIAPCPVTANRIWWNVVSKDYPIIPRTASKNFITDTGFDK